MFFMCLSLLISGAIFPYFISLLAIVIILYLSISDYLLVWIEFIQETLGVGTVEEAIEALLFLLSVSACLPPATSYMHCTSVVSLRFGEPYWRITIHPSD